MSKREEIAKQLNQYNKEINEAIRDKPDEETGHRVFDPVASEFLTGRQQVTVFTSFMDFGSHVSIDMYEPISKVLVIDRTVEACRGLIDLMQTHIERLELLKVQGETK